MNDSEEILQELKGIRTDISDLKEGQGELIAVQQEQGKKLDGLDKKVEGQDKKLDTLTDGQSHIITTLETLEGTIKETKEEVDEIKRRQRPHKVD